MCLNEKNLKKKLGFSVLIKFFYHDDFTIIYPITVSNFDVSKSVPPQWEMAGITIQRHFHTCMSLTNPIFISTTKQIK